MDFAQRHHSPLTHLPGAIFTFALHVAIIYALITGLSVQVVRFIHGPIETRLIEELKPPPPEETPLPPPKLAPPPPAFVPLPELRIAAPVSANAITVVTHAPPVPKPEAAPVKAAAPVRTAPVIDARRSCATPEYPSASKRLEETGTVVLHFLIDVNGRAIDSRIESSSGYPRLDEAARSALGSCKFKPGTVDGKPEPSWAALKYTWKLN